MTMNTVESPHAPVSADLYDPEKDAQSRGSPPLKQVQLRWGPSPSPRDSPDSECDENTESDSPEEESTQSRRMRPIATQGDAVLLSLLGSGNGNTPNVALEASLRTLPAADEDVEMMSGDHPISVLQPDLQEKDDQLMTALARRAVSAMASIRGEIDVIKTEPKREVEQKRENLHHVSPKVASMSETHEIHELPPIQMASPKAEKDNRLTLPSISDIGLNGAGAADNGAGGHRASFSSHSPPQPQFFPPRGLVHSNSKAQGSPPISPPETFRRPLPSPGRSDPYYNNYGPPRRSSYATDAPSYSTSPSNDYASSATETPSTDQSTPAAGIDRMRIDGITNPPPGGFVCGYPNCSAQAFQTQYLLNSHANVHSQIRPHYCPVAGCPRGEGGKGFKRKNEMIRHGLVHESPGYVCPYCRDREHKYPRPDNLQRHVRVHHMDKDKDDPLLRDVLAQRPEGPSRGRRRRGNNT